MLSVRARNGLRCDRGAIGGAERIDSAESQAQPDGERRAH